MRVIRWKNAVTGVESLNISATGIYFPVGKTDSSFIARYSMASAEQTASVERVSSPDGSRVGSPPVNVSGTTEVVVNERRGLSTGIIVTAISGTLISVLDDNTPITNFPDAGLGRFPAKEDADAYVYGSTVPQGIPATIGGVPYSWGGAGVGWVVVAVITPNKSAISAGTRRYLPFETSDVLPSGYQANPWNFSWLRKNSYKSPNQQHIASDVGGYVAARQSFYLPTEGAGGAFKFSNDTSHSPSIAYQAPLVAAQLDVSNHVLVGGTTSKISVRLTNSDASYVEFSIDRRTLGYTLTKTTFGDSPATGTIPSLGSAYRIGVAVAYSQAFGLIDYGSGWVVVAKSVVAKTNYLAKAKYSPSWSFSANGSDYVLSNDIRSGYLEAFALADPVLVSNEDGTTYRDERGGYYITLTSRFFAYSDDANNYGIDSSHAVLANVDRRGNVKIVSHIFNGYDRQTSATISNSPVQIVFDRDDKAWRAFCGNLIATVNNDPTTSEVIVANLATASGPLGSLTSSFDTAAVKISGLWYVATVDASSGYMQKVYSGQTLSALTLAYSYADAKNGQAIKVARCGAMLYYIVSEQSETDQSKLWSIRNFPDMTLSTHSLQNPGMKNIVGDPTQRSSPHAMIVPVPGSFSTTYHMWVYDGHTFSGNPRWGYGDLICFESTAVAGSDI